MYHLQPTQPYSFALSIKRLLDMPRQIIARAEPGPNGPVYVRAVDQGGRLGSVRIWQEGEQLAVATEGDLDAQQTLAQVRKAFNLDLDLAAFHAHMAEHDPVMAGLARKYYGARPIEAFSLWEALAWAIIGQQITVSFAFTLKEALVRHAGRSFGGLPTFPAPEFVAQIPYETLQAEKYSRKKAEYVIDIARAIVERRLHLEEIVALPFDEAVKELVKLRGVGRWTAECLLMDAGRLDAFPADDIGIRNAVARFYGLDHQPTAAEVREIGKAWVPYSALACYYLWLGLLDKG